MYTCIKEPVVTSIYLSNTYNFVMFLQANFSDILISDK